MGEEETKAEALYSIRLDRIDGRKITLTKLMVDDLGERRKTEDVYELAENSQKTLDDLIPYLGKMVNVTLVNNKVYDVTSA
jgi:hypothetical protein